jgi:hypothetical protein
MAAQLLRTVDKLQANTLLLLLLLLLLPCIQTLDASLSLAFFMNIEFWVLFRIRLATRNQICNMQAKLQQLLQFKLFFTFITNSANKKTLLNNSQVS